MLAFKQGVLICLISFLLANGLSYLFIPYKTYVDESIVRVNLSSQERMAVRSMIKYKYVSQPFFSNTRILKPNQDNWIEIPIDSALEIENIAIYWGGEKIDKLLYKRAELTIGSRDQVQFLNPSILYNSDSVYVDVSGSVTTIISNKKSGQNWSMLNLTSKVNRLRGKEKNRFLSVWSNIILVVIFVVVLYAKHNRIYLALTFLKRIFLKNPIVLILTLWLVIYPFNYKFATPFLILSCLFTFYNNWGISLWKEYIRKNLFINIYFLFVLASLLVLNEPQRELKSVISYLTLVFIPFPFLFLRNHELRIISSTFIISIVFYLLIFTLTLVSSPISKGLNLIVSFRNLFYDFWHPAYFAFLVLIGLVILKSKIKWLLVYSVASLLLFIIIDSRSGILALIITFTLLSINKTLSIKIRRITYFVFFASLCVAIYISIINLYNIDKEARPALWKSALEVAKSNPIFGVGAYNVTDEIKQTKTIKESLRYRGFNAHNQFLEILVSKGSIGLILFLLYILNPISRSLKDSYFYFIIIVFIMFFFESFLGRQAGMSTFAFWHAFFLKFSDDKR